MGMNRAPMWTGADSLVTVRNRLGRKGRLEERSIRSMYRLMNGYESGAILRWP